jgi:hypothetical protein
MYAISRNSFDVAFRTFASAFPYASFWYVRGHGLFVGSLEPLPIDFPTLSARFNEPAVRQDFASIGINSPHELMAHLFMDNAQVRRYLETAPGVGSELNTDDNGHLEYATPSEFLLPTKRILEALRPFANWDRSVLIGATDDDLAKIDQLYAERKAKLLEELDTPIE